MRSVQPADIETHANSFIQRQLGKNSTYLSREEQVAEYWCVYLEAIRSYSKVAGCCVFDEYLDFCAQERFGELKTQRNAQFALESKLSLDKNTPNGERIGWLVGSVGDCSKSIMLWDYINSFSEEERYVAERLFYENSPPEIVAEGRISMDKYRDILLKLRERFCDWEVA